MRLKKGGTRINQSGSGYINTVRELPYSQRSSQSPYSGCQEEIFLARGRMLEVEGLDGIADISKSGRLWTWLRSCGVDLTGGEFVERFVFTRYVVVLCWHFGILGVVRRDGAVAVRGGRTRERDAMG